MIFMLVMLYLGCVQDSLSGTCTMIFLTVGYLLELFLSTLFCNREFEGFLCVMLQSCLITTGFIDALEVG